MSDSVSQSHPLPSSSNDHITTPPPLPRSPSPPSPRQQHEKNFYYCLKQKYNWRGKNGEGSCDGGKFSRSMIDDTTMQRYIRIFKQKNDKCKRKTAEEYYLTSRYELKEGFLYNSKKLSKIVSVGQIYEEICISHIATGHGGEKRTFHDLKFRGIANISLKHVNLFVSTCEICLKKRANLPSKPSNNINHIISSDFGERGQVDLIDMSNCRSTSHRYILNYQDNLTKYCLIRPLVHKDVHSVIKELIDIFSVIGCPKILQCDNGLEFNFDDELKAIWKDIKIIHGRPRHPQSQGSVERANQDIQQMLRCWLSDNVTTDWVKGLPFVQMQKNNAYNRTISCSPYFAVFGRNMSIKPARYENNNNHLRGDKNDGDSGDGEEIDGEIDLNDDDDDEDEDEDDHSNIGDGEEVDGEIDLNDDDEDEDEDDPSNIVDISSDKDMGIGEEADSSCDHLENARKLEMVRRRISENTRKEAQKHDKEESKSGNSKKRNGNIFKIGTIVTINIPKWDRFHKMEFNNVLCRVIQYFPDSDKYKLASLQSGTNIKSLFSHHVLNHCKNFFRPIVPLERYVDSGELPLRSIVKKERTIFLGCKCLSNCRTKKCKCRVAGKKCVNGLCHTQKREGAKDCINK